MTCVDHVTLRRVKNTYTDHVIRLSMCDPSGMPESLPRYVVMKQMQWSINLPVYIYMVEHIPGNENAWADMLSTCASHEFGSIGESELSCNSLILPLISPSMREDLE